MREEEIIDLINEDIRIQKKFLTGEFEKDKATQWRITGMKYLKKRILERRERETYKCWYCEKIHEVGTHPHNEDFNFHKELRKRGMI